MRAQSNFVKKGKYVRRILELMQDGDSRTLEDIWNDGKNGVGPTQEYVRHTLNKLVTSGELVLSGDQYISPNAEPVDNENEDTQGEESPTQEPRRGEESQPRQQEPARQEQPRKQAEGLLPRNQTFEDFLSFAFLNEIPGWENAVEYYCKTHGASYYIVTLKGHMGGERLRFE